MALFLFILSINPLSFPLSKVPGYKVRPPGKITKFYIASVYRRWSENLCSRHPRSKITTWSHHKIWTCNLVKINMTTFTMKEAKKSH